MSQYTESFKRSTIEKLLAPNSIGAYKLASSLGVPIATLYDWKKKFASGVNVKTKTLDQLSREAKLDILIKTSTMTENELGAYLREQGLHSSDLLTIREEMINGPKDQKTKNDPELIKLRQTVAKTEKDLKRKDKALAEMAARVVLLKKSHEIWGEPEDEE